MVEVKATSVALGTSAAYVGREFVSAQGPNAPKIFVRSGKQLFGGKVGFESYRTNIRENKKLGPEGFEPSTPRLKGECSTPELRTPRGRAPRGWILAILTGFVGKGRSPA